VSASVDPHGLAAGVALDVDDAVLAVVEGGGVDAVDAGGGPASSVTGAREPGGLVRSPRAVPASADDEWLPSEPLEWVDPAPADDEDDELPQPLAEAPASATMSAARRTSRDMRVIMVRLR
jgi:hypothetical protein